MSDAASKALKAYEEKHEKKPKDAASLVAFVKTNKALKTITIEEAEAVLNPEKKDSKNNEAKDEDEEEDNSKASTTATPAKMETPLYAVGDDVLMSKDRVGKVRYVGAIPEMGPGLWYGVELMDGSIGQTDGMARGKRYFTTEGKRALFVPPLKIRRKLNDKDRKKHDSMRFTQERKSTEPSNPTSNETSNKPASNDTAAPSTTTERAPAEPQAKESTPPQSNSEEPSIDATKEPAVNDSPRRPSTLKQAIGISAAETYETLLAFILRQSEEVREQLLDVYASPQLHKILVSAYGELKNMERDEQELVWNALLTRWRRFG